MATNPRFWVTRSEPLTIDDTPAGAEFLGEARAIAFDIAMALKNSPYVTDIGVTYNSAHSKVVFSGVFSAHDKDAARNLASLIFSDAITEAGCVDTPHLAELRVRALRQLNEAMREELATAGSDDFMFVRELTPA